MKKHKDVQEILRRNGISGYTNLENVTVMGGYYETFVLWQSGGSAKIATADTNTPDDVTIATGDTSISVAASGESYFLLSGVSSASINSIPITGDVYSGSVDTKFSGETISPSETVDAENGYYYTYLGKGLYGLAFRILNASSSGATLTIESLSITASPTGDTEDGTYVDSTATLTVKGTYDNGTTTDLTDDVDWESSNTSVATVSSTGIMTPVAAGTSTITATYNDPLTEASTGATYDITVLGVSSVDILGTPTGDTAAFTYSGSTSVDLDLKLIYSDGSSGSTDEGVTYESSDVTVATVIEATGVLTYVSTGTTTITATYGEFTDTQDITFN
jgi:hypothetical protein